MKPLLVYITTKDSSEAEQISKRLLEERFAAVWMFFAVLLLVFCCTFAGW